MLGNILLLFSLIAYVVLASLLLRPAPSGDYSVGYSFALLIYGPAFILITGLLAWNMNLNHCFDWLPASLLRYRNGVVLLGWLTFVVANFWALAHHSKWTEGEFPQFMRWLALSKVYVWLPVLMFVSAIYLLNTSAEATLAPFWAKTALKIGFCTSLLIGLGIFYGFAKASVQRRANMYEAAQKDKEDENGWAFNQSMNDINTYQEATVKNLLVYTHREQDERLRNAAVAKIKSYEHWENDLIQTLEHGEIAEVYWVFAFLDGSRVELSKDFTSPVQQGLGRLTPWLRASLEDPHSLQMGYINVEAICRVLDYYFKGKDQAAQFRPAVLTIQKVLSVNAPERRDKTNQKWFAETLEASREAVKNWLAANQ